MSDKDLHSLIEEEENIRRDWTRVGYAAFFELHKGDWVPGRGIILEIDSEARVIEFSSSQPARISSERWVDPADGFVGVHRQYAFIVDEEAFIINEDPDIHDDD